MTKLELRWPLNHHIIAQGFGGNDNTYYADNRLVGHPGLDLVTTYGDVVRFAQDGRVYKTINFSNPDPMAYRAVMQIVDLEGTDDATRSATAMPKIA